MLRKILMVILVTMTLVGTAQADNVEHENAGHGEHGRVEDAGGADELEKGHDDHEKNPAFGTAMIILGVLVLGIILYATVIVENLTRKVAIYLFTAGGTCLFLWGFGGESAVHALHHVFVVDYPQFLPVPLATIFIASLDLFGVRIKRDASLGWFLWVLCPIAGNFATTWSMVPIALSIVGVLIYLYPKRWLMITIATCVFCMNFLAVGTLSADPPQALWAVKRMQTEGAQPLGYFFPLVQFWPYILFTQVLYLVVLRRLGVTFGSPLEILKIRPISWARFTLGCAIAAAVGLSVTFLQGYQITAILGGCVCVPVALLSLWFGHEERHNTLHWGLETATVFVGFFSVVALVYTGLHHLEMSDESMIAVVVAMTEGADNAAAFAAGYDHFADKPDYYMTWYNLFNSIVFGGTSPFGNGPQIVFFLVILTKLKKVRGYEGDEIEVSGVTAGRVCWEWVVESSVYLPYLLTWSLSMALWVKLMDSPPSIIFQLLIGIVATAVAFQAMDLWREFKPHVDDEDD